MKSRTSALPCVLTAQLRRPGLWPGTPYIGWQRRQRGPSGEGPAPGPASTPISLAQPRRSLLSAPHGSPDGVVPRGSARALETGRRRCSNQKMACRACACASCQPCPHFGLGTGRRLGSAVAWAEFNFYNERVSSAQRRVRGVYSLLPALPGHLLGRTALNPMSSWLQTRVDPQGPMWFSEKRS